MSGYQISNETRLKKSEPFVSKEYSFAKWVEEYAEANGLEPKDVAEMALFKQEGIEYIPSDVQKTEME